MTSSDFSEIERLKRVCKDCKEAFNRIERLVNDSKMIFYCADNASVEYTSLKLSHAEDADAVKVVRCKDCKYLIEDYYTDGNVPYWICKEWDSGTDYDGYCYLGERKDG